MYIGKQKKVLCILKESWKGRLCMFERKFKADLCIWKENEMKVYVYWKEKKFKKRDNVYGEKITEILCILKEKEKNAIDSEGNHSQRRALLYLKNKNQLGKKSIVVFSTIRGRHSQRRALLQQKLKKKWGKN